MTRDVTTRPLTTEDEPLLVRATLDNLNWSNERFTEGDLQRGSEFHHYTQLVPGRGDFGFVAECSDEAVGLVWALFLPADDPGYGFVDEQTPEVSLWVREDRRGRGLGTMLLRQLQKDSTNRRVGRLSLSVEADNHAKRLYASEGFIAVAGRERDGVMVWTRPADSA